MDPVTALLLCGLHGTMRHDGRCSTIAMAAERVVAPETRALALTTQIGVAPGADPSNSLDPLERWQPFIAEASRRFAIPEAWIRVVMRAESGGRSMPHDTPITSRAGAMGLMQVMPETYREMRRRYGLDDDPYDPHDNIFAGTAYLRQMLDRFGYPQLFAAYNAGPRRFAAYLQGAEALPAETWAYLATIGPELPRAIAGLSAGSGAASITVARSPLRSGRVLFFTVGSLSGVLANTSGMMSPESGSRRDLSLPRAGTGALFVPLGPAPLAATDRSPKR